MGKVKNNETLWEKWIIPLFVSLGSALFIRLFSFETNNLNGLIEEIGKFFNFEFVISLISSGLVLFPLIYLTRKLLQTKASISVIKRDLETINSKLNSEIDQSINSIDEHTFKPDRIHFYKNEFSKIHNLSQGSETHILKFAINDVLGLWKEKATDENTDLYQLIYHYLVKDLKDFNNSNTFIIPLKTYLDLLLSIINIGFNINKKFFYYSFTNAEPFEWFKPLGENSPLDSYRKEFAELIEQHNNSSNDLRRFVLTYAGRGKNFIPSYDQFLKNWEDGNKMSPECKKHYIEKFITNENAYVLKLHNDFIIKQGFTELIYIGGSDSKGNPEWKWVVKGEYVQDSKSMIFQMHNLKGGDKNQQIIGEFPESEGSYLKENSDTLRNKNKSINIGEFPEAINSEFEIFQTDGKRNMLFELKKLKISNGNSDETTI